MLNEHVTNTSMYLPQVHWGDYQTLMWSLLAIYGFRSLAYQCHMNTYGVYLWNREELLI